MRWGRGSAEWIAYGRISTLDLNNPYAYRRIEQNQR